MSTIPVRYTFNTGERLKSRKIIDELFRRKSFYSSPGFRLYYMKMERPLSEFAAQYAFAVSKKHFPKAPDRNRVKRLMREAVRLRKNDLQLQLTAGQQYALLIMFTGRNLPNFKEAERAVETLFSQLK
jgi:ribonuclease P protein component